MKKKKVRKSVVALIISAILLIPMYIGAFLNIFSFKTVSSNSITIIEEYGMFADLSNVEESLRALGFNFSSWLLIMNNVLLLLTMIFGIFLIIDLILRLLKVKRSKVVDTLFKINTILLFISSILMISFGLLASVTNTFVVSKTLGITQKIDLSAGYYLQLPSIVASILGLLTFADRKK